jgi:hypothetical protein
LSNYRARVDKGGRITYQTITYFYLAELLL